jgi:hypothetical protein
MLMKSIPEKRYNYSYYGSDRGASDTGASEDGGEDSGIKNVREPLVPLANSVVFIIEKLPRSSSCPNAGACEGT